MHWIVLLVAVGILGWLALRAPRIAMTAVAAVTTVLLVMGVLFYLLEFLSPAAERDVTAEIIFDLQHCPLEKPLALRVVNGASRAISSVRFYVVARRPGFSDELAQSGLRRSDRIIAAGEQWRSCHALPRNLMTEPDVASLEYSTTYFEVRWQ